MKITSSFVHAALCGIVCSLSTAGAAHAAISFDEAVQIALGRVPGVVHSVERETKLGVEVFEVEVRTGDARELEVLIDAGDGKILRVQEDR